MGNDSQKQSDQKIDWDVHFSDRDYFVLCFDGVKEDATIPIYLPEHDPHGSHLKIDINGSEQILKPEVLESSLVSGYTNPLPHVLMLTAIVVGVATLGLALSVCLRIYRGYGTVEEDELMEELEREDARNVGGPHRRRPRRRRSSRKPSSVTESRKSSAEEKHTAERPKTRRHRSTTRKKKKYWRIEILIPIKRKSQVVSPANHPFVSLRRTILDE